MKRLIVLCILTSLLLSACISAQPQETSNNSEPTQAEISETPANTDVSENSVASEVAENSVVPDDSEDSVEPDVSEESPQTTHADLTEDEIRKITDAVITSEYGITDFSDYTFRCYTNSKGVTVYYDLYIFGIRTYEGFSVTLNSDFSVERHDFDNEGMAAYINLITDEMFNDTKEKLVNQFSHIDSEDLDRTPHFYFDFDSEGWLCLRTELIVYTENGACGDHDHLFFSQRLCAPIE